MNAQLKSYRSIGKLMWLTMLVVLVLIGTNWTGRLALAQEPDPPIELPPPGQPPATEPVAPPDEAELGEPVKADAYLAGDDSVDEPGGPVNIVDLAFVAAHYGTFDPAADLNLDGIVNILDLALLAQNFDQTETVAGVAGLPAPPPLPVAEAGQDFGVFELAVEPDPAEVEAQCCVWRRPLRIGLGVDYVRAYDPMDSYSAPDLYAVASVGGVAARTNTIFDQYASWPAWRLGWWQYASFPRSSWHAPESNYYSVPLTLEIRDDDGRICYGWWGCRDQFDLADVSPRLYQRAKLLTLYPSSCRVVDEAGVSITGYWLDSNRCRIQLASWGTEWPRAFVNYFIDTQWQ